LTDRITELWNDRPRPERTADRLSPDRPSADSVSPNQTSDRSSSQPADRFTNREFARFSDLEPLTPDSAPPAPANPTPGPTLASSSSPGSTSTRIRSWTPQPSAPTPRAVGAPLPTGSALTATPSSSASHSRAGASAQPEKSLSLGRGLPHAQSAATSVPSGTDIPSGVQRLVNAVRATLPFIQRILPLLDGNVGTAVSNLMAPPPHRPAPPPPPINIAPLQEGISTLQAQQGELRTQIADQNTSLKRVEDQLEAVREATDRNTLEQQELLEDLKSVGNKVNIFAMVALLLLVVSVMVNVILYLHIKRVLP
jgi:hypothetical protein